MKSAAGQQRDRWRDRGLTALIVIGLGIILAVCFDFYYDLNDDMAMKDILSGTYTGSPDGHNIQSLYPLGLCISLCYRILPAVPWYGLFLCGCQFFALWLGVNSFCGLCRDRRQKAVAALLLTAGTGVLFLYEFVFVQYTVTAGLLVCAALVRVYRGPRAGSAEFTVYHLVTAAVVGLAFYLRTEIVMLLCPLLGLAVLFRVAEDWAAIRGGNDRNIKKDDINDTSVRNERIALVKSCGFLLAVMVVILAAGLIANRAAYGSEEWRRFRQFFDDRTELYDFYGIPSYENNRQFYDSIGLSEAQYTLLENYNFDLDDDIDTQMMHEIAVYASQHQEKSMARRLYESVYAYGYRFTHGEELIFDLLLVVTYFFLARAALAEKKPLLLGKLALVLGVRTALWLFLLYRGRAPERVTHPLYLMELILLVLLFVSDTDVFRWKKFQKSAILSMYAVLFVCTAFLHIGSVKQIYEDRQSVNVQWQLWKQYCRERPEQFYYLDVYSSVAYSEKLFSDISPAYRNFDLPGGWCVKSPLSKQKRQVSGFESAAEGLLAGRAYFAADNTREERSPDFLTAYFAEKGREITIQETDRCGNFSVYLIR